MAAEKERPRLRWRAVEARETQSTISIADHRLADNGASPPQNKSAFCHPKIAAKRLGGEARGSQVLCPGPGHSPRDRSLSVRLEWQAPEGFVVHSFAGDDPLDCREHVRRVLGIGTRGHHFSPRAKCPTKAEPRKDSDNTGLARDLWRQRQAITGTIAEKYLRQARGYSGPIPATLGFLPSRGKHGPAMIAAFGIAQEPEPGALSIASEDVRAVHLTRLIPDGSGRVDKIMIGRGATGFPIVVAPMNDLLGLAITEGIEDALAIHEAMGLGAWAAGSASRLPALAERIPVYADHVLIVGDDDSGPQICR